MVIIMTKPNTSHIVVVLDRSGSMRSVMRDTIGGFNTFLAEQRKLKDSRATMTLVQFDDQYQFDYKDRLLSDVSDLNEDTFVPRGNTALLDAIGKTIVTVGESLRSLSESERPSRVVMVVMTDGHENWSKEYTREKVFEMISHQRDKYAWEFVFMGADEKSIQDAHTYGFSAGSTAHYSSTSAGTQRAFKRLSTNMASYRSASDEDRVRLCSNFFDGSNDLTDENEKKTKFTAAVKTIAGTGQSE
jgi:uncharacterized protein YegL